MLALVLVLAAWAFWLEPASLRVVDYRLTLPHWPGACSGLRIALVADLHVGSPWNGVEKLDRVIAQIREARPDLILFAGDFVIQGVRGGKLVEPETIVRAARVAQRAPWRIRGARKSRRLVR